MPKAFRRAKMLSTVRPRMGANWAAGIFARSLSSSGGQLHEAGAEREQTRRSRDRAAHAALYCGRQKTTLCHSAKRKPARSSQCCGRGARKSWRSRMEAHEIHH
jgi:hypothetical protein